ncbi:MAG: fibronectin type III domain-containing protein [Calditrichaeota bacterium]|nr:MAG: fibronectin type III domain-containing protein [Calditrichota bacterium]
MKINMCYKKLLFTASILLILFQFADTIRAQEVININIGSLHSWYRSDGSEIEEGGTIIEQQSGLAWPAQYADQDNQAAKAFWIATKNYTDADQYGGVTYPFKVVHVGPRGADPLREFMPIEFKLIGRHEHPQVYVDGSPASDLMFIENLAEVDPDLISDRMIYNEVNTSVGVTMIRKIYAWGQQYHDNYFIYEYIFKNTGNVDPDPEIEQQVTLEDVYFFWQYRYAASREGAQWTDLNSPRWGINEMLSTRGEPVEPNGGYPAWLNGVSAADSMRVQYAWMGRHSKAAYDLIGSPDVKYGSGRLGSPQYMGNITLHADTDVNDKNDDPFQPTTTSFVGSDEPETRPNEQFNPARMTDEYGWAATGHMWPRHDDIIGEGFPDIYEGTPGGFSNASGYGPYTMAPGDSVRIVIAEGVNGISREKCIEVGVNWLEAYNNPSETFTFDLPDGSTTNDKDEYKNAWVFTGEDSLFKTLGRARRNFDLNYEIAVPPPPPSLFQVNSGGDRISLSWSDDAESDANFSGYRIYRAIARYDTTFEVIYECGTGTENTEIVHEYNDTSVEPTTNYYYYISSFSDGGNNNTNANPSGQLESSMFWTRTTQPAKLLRPAGEKLADIRVVPNPFDIRSRIIQFPGEQDKLEFIDIPGICTIRIYTERGDLIRTIEHTNGSGSEAWNSETDHGQIVVSGVYIATFETPEGDTAIRKFIIIR